MTIEQTVEIPANHRLVIDVPRDIPAGKAILSFTSVANQRAKDQRSDKPAPENADEGATSPVDALFALFAPIRGTVDIDEIRTERLLAKHFKHLK